MTAVLQFVIPFTFMVLKKQANNCMLGFSPASDLRNSNPTADQLHRQIDRQTAISQIVTRRSSVSVKQSI